MKTAWLRCRVFDSAFSGESVFIINSNFIVEFPDAVITRALPDAVSYEGVVPKHYVRNICEDNKLGEVKVVVLEETPLGVKIRTPEGQGSGVVLTVSKRIIGDVTEHEPRVEMTQLVGMLTLCHEIKETIFPRIDELLDAKVEDRPAAMEQIVNDYETGTDVDASVLGIMKVILDMMKTDLEIDK